MFDRFYDSEQERIETIRIGAHTVRCSKVERTCNQCGKKIPPGSMVTREVWKVDGDLSAIYMHGSMLECEPDW